MCRMDGCRVICVLQIAKGPAADQDRPSLHCHANMWLAGSTFNVVMLKSFVKMQ